MLSSQQALISKGAPVSVNSILHPKSIEVGSIPKTKIYVVFGSKAPELKIKELELDTHALITVRPAHGSVPLVGWNIPAFTAKFNPSSIQLSIKISASIS